MNRHTPFGHRDLWIPVLSTDDRLRGLYMRHYSSEKATMRRGPVASNQLRIVGPGETLCLLTLDGLAGWAWRRSQFRQDGEEGVECAMYRNEGTRAAAYGSCLVLGAMWYAQQKWPGVRLFTYVDPKRIQSNNPGYCYLRAGWRRYKKASPGRLIALEYAA